MQKTEVGQTASSSPTACMYPPGFAWTGPVGRVEKTMRRVLFVYVWRHRDSRWKRRRGSAFTPSCAGISLAISRSWRLVRSNIKLLSAMCASSNGPYCLYSIDVSDAYLLVPQRKQTIVKLKGVLYILGFNLPGQRQGAHDCFEHLASASKEKNVVPDIGLPSLFYKKRNNEEENENPMLLNSHVDNLQMLGKEADQEKLIEFLQKEKGWKLKVEGPVYPTERECNFLERACTVDSEDFT